MRARWTPIAALAAAIVVVALPGIAQEDSELDPADRVLIHTYNADSMRLLWSTQLGDAEAAAEECGLDADPETEYTFEVDEDGEVTVDGLEEDCTFNATDVTGPEGQVNHGTVVSAFVKALKDSDVEGGIGCYVRIIAQSDYGKGDDQVQASDADTTDPDTETISGETTFEVSETTCGRPDHAGRPEDAGKPDHAGRPDHAGPPDHAGRPDHAGPPDHAKGRP